MWATDILEQKSHPISKTTSSIISLFILSLLAFCISCESRTTAHDELTKYGFPIGLLPTNVESYTLNRTSGDFSINLGYRCRVTLPPDNYVATYSPKITGKIVDNRIGELDGISVRAFFKSWGITGIRSSGHNLVFEVGMVSAKYPSKNFDKAPSCLVFWVKDIHALSCQQCIQQFDKVGDGTN